MAEAQTQIKTDRLRQRLAEALASGRAEPVRMLINSLQPGEIAVLLESLPPEKRLKVWRLVDAEHDGEVLVEVNDEVRAGLISDMDSHELVAAAEDLDLDDLADILDDLPDDVIRQVVDGLDEEEQEKLTQVLSYPEDSAGGLMNPLVITIRSDVTLGAVLRYIRRHEELPEHFDHVYVVDRSGHYIGRLSIRDLLTHDPEDLVADHMDTSLQAYRLDTPANVIAQDFENNDLISAPVVDENGILVGRVTIDDVVDYIRDEADQTVLGMAGLDEEEDTFAPPFRSARKRWVWLGVNAISALTVAWFIRRFEATLDQIVALAVLMPVIASMGGNAGNQTMTLVIRGLSTGIIGTGNISALFSKEIMVGLLNGLVWSILMGLVVALWFHDLPLALVVAGGLGLNLLVAATAGALVPILLKRLGIDPAIAGSVILMTITDVVGFVIFLGLGTMFLLPTA